MVSARDTVLVAVLMVMALTCFGPEAFAGLIDPLRPATYLETRPSEITAPEEDPESSLNRFKVTAILVGDNRAIAVVNGQRLQVGQMIQGYRLTEIGPDHVVLRKDRQQLTIPRSGSPLRKSPTNHQVHR